MITTASNKGQPLSTVTADKDGASKDQPLSRQVPPASRESQVRTRKWETDQTTQWLQRLRDYLEDLTGDVLRTPSI